MTISGFADFECLEPILGCQSSILGCRSSILVDFAHPDFRFGRFWHLGAQSGRFWWFLRFLKLCPLFIGIGFSVLEGPERLFAPLFSPKYSISHVSVHRGVWDMWYLGVWDMWYMRYRVYDIWDIAIAIAKAIAIARYTVYRLYGYSYSYS